jgi:hypothetical protein
MERNVLGILFIIVGVFLFVRNPRIWLQLKRGKVRGIAGPALIILGILILTGVLPGIS